MKAFACVMALASVAQSAIVAPLSAGLAYSGYGLGSPLAYGAAPAHLTYAAAPAPLAYAAAPAPVTYAHAPVVAAPAVYAAAAPQIASSQFQQQDEFGNLAYGYSNINSAKQESGNTYGGVAGSYSYVDANGQLQTTNYVADALGFRVQATNLPVAPVANLAQPQHTLVGPAPVGKTAEVQAAEAEFFAKFEEAASRSKRSIVAPINYGFPYSTYAAAPVAPLTYAAPVAAAPVAATGAREGILTRIQNNPGFAVSYRVD